MRTLIYVYFTAILLAGALFVGSLFLKVRYWIRIPISLVLFAAIGYLASFLPYTYYDYYQLPPQERVAAELQMAYMRRTKTAIMEDLGAKGFHPRPNQGPFNPDFGEYGIDKAIALSAHSLIWIDNIRVRPGNAFGEYLRVVYLFDDNGNSLTWSYYVVSPCS